MSRKLFSDEEMADLAANPYTDHVTARQIIFTKEFKERFRTEYCAGKTPAEIIRRCGYSVEVLGERRIGGIREHIRKESMSPGGFQCGRSLAVVEKEEHRDETSADAIREMRQELQYMRKELDFLKKIISIRGMKKSGDFS